MLLDCARIVQTTVVYQERNNNLKWKNPLTYLRRIGTSLLYNAGLIEGERERERKGLQAVFPQNRTIPVYIVY